jgi:SAM-dependent methyltransferase
MGENLAMNDEKWRNLINELTLGIEEEHTTYDFSYNHVKQNLLNNPESNHLGITLNFFKKRQIDNESKVFLDVGCEYDILKEFIKAKWIGCDIVKTQKTDYADAHELPYKDEEFDIVFCSHTLEHCISPAIVLYEMRRVLKIDGDVIIGVPHWPEFICNEHTYLLTHGGWKHLFERIGFKVIDEQDGPFGCSAYHLKKIPGVINYKKWSK